MTTTRSPERRRTSLAESFLLMGTVVTIRVVGEDGAHRMREDIDRAIMTMRSVESTLSRFDESSALRELCRTPGVLVPVPAMLFHALKVAVEVAALTNGAFDPTIGRQLEELGFNRHYLTGEEVRSEFASSGSVSFRDVTLVDEGLQVRLEKPMSLDLGAVAKGLAVDLAARDLSSWDGFAVDAGGDVFVSGVDPHGGTWRVGVEDPKDPRGFLARLKITDAAICTSGNYKRRSPKNPAAHHLVDARTKMSAEGLVSCTVVGPQAMMADVASTAAFLLGPDRAIPFLEEMGLSGMCVTAEGEIRETIKMGALKDG